MNVEDMLKTIEWYIEQYERDWYDAIGSGNLVDRLRTLLADADEAYQLRYTKKRALIVERDQWRRKAEVLATRLADISPLLFVDIDQKLAEVLKKEREFCAAIRAVMPSRYSIIDGILTETKVDPEPSAQQSLTGDNHE